MSLAEVPMQEGPPSDLGRTPPQDVAAEQSVLGGMMLSKDAIADVVEVLRGNDFYRPAHETVYDAILDLYGRGEPADAVTVADELTKRGDLSRVGGPAYLHTLISSVPTAANAGFYARIVRERAVLRRLVEAGTRIVQLGYGGADGRGGGDVDEIVNNAQAEVYAVTETRTTEDYVPLSEVIEGAIDEIEASSHRGDGLTGVPTGFADLDRLTNGLHPGQMIVIAARPAMGKALALDTALPTPQGWTTMGEVQVGDELIGADGRPTTVTAATEVMTGRPCFEVTFSDGAVIVADAEHQWLTEARSVTGGTTTAVRTTAEIAATLHCPVDVTRPNHSVADARPLELPLRDLPIAPYAVGAWLGAGVTSATTGADPAVVMRLEAEESSAIGRPSTADERPEADEPSVAHERVVAGGRTVTALDRGRIPAEYLRAGLSQRRDLLAGLLDTAAVVGVTGAVQLRLESESLAEDVRELVTGLGCQPSLQASSSSTEDLALPGALSPVLSFTSDDDVFWLESKLLEHKEHRRHRRQHRDSRAITAVRPIPSVPVRCVEVANADHLYLAGRAMVPTHNSTLGLDIARAAALHHQMAAVMFSLEMGRNEITMRLLSAEARIPLQHMRKGTMREEDWTRLAKTMGEVSEAPFFIDDSPNMSLMEIRAKCRRLKQRHDLKLVVIDYLQLMTSGKRVESRQQEVSEFSRALKLLAKELQLPVIALSQLNRGPEQRTDKKPAMSDLRESGCLTADTKVLRADTGAEVTMGELYRQGATDVPVWSLDDSLRYVRRHLTHVFPTGRKPVFRVRLASGKEVRATANHPFLTYEGWRPIGDLTPGARVATPRHVMAPESVTVRGDDEVGLLADRIGQVARPNGESTGLPTEVFSLPKRQITLFLRQLWAARGSVAVAASGRSGQVHLVSTSRELVDGVSRLLLRFGISSSIRSARAAGDGEDFTLEVSAPEDQKRFLNEIGVLGRQGPVGGQLLAALRNAGSVPAVGTVPGEVWSRVRSVLADQEGADGQVATVTRKRIDKVARSTNRAPGKKDPGRERLGRVAELLGDAELEMLAVNDVLWDTVVAVEQDGEEDVFDATVVGTHNFVANGIAVHNSIEQDADMVILLHREDAYEKESPRAGEADFIVAKHRNGPTDTITVAFQGHYSRFVDMAT